MATELHLVFLVTPMGEDLSPEHLTFCNVLGQLPVWQPYLALCCTILAGLECKFSLLTA